MAPCQLRPKPGHCRAIWGLLLMGISCLACRPTASPPAPYHHMLPWQARLDSAHLSGLIFVTDGQRIWTQDTAALRRGYLPASTFKIPHSLIALETGVVASDTSLFPWDGQPRQMAAWEADLPFREAFQRSCVPCYQEVARRIGLARMQQWLDTLAYGHMVVDSSSLDRFWLTGPSRISPQEQVDFLQRLYAETLPLSARTFRLMRQIMAIDTTGERVLYGKTGWAIRPDGQHGWFVGYETAPAGVRFFATLVEPGPDFDMARLAALRIDLTRQALAQTWP